MFDFLTSRLDEYTKIKTYLLENSYKVPDIIPDIFMTL
jgi:hypothetical protein